MVAVGFSTTKMGWVRPIRIFSRFSFCFLSSELKRLGPLTRPPARDFLLKHGGYSSVPPCEGSLQKLHLGESLTSVKKNPSPFKGDLGLQVPGKEPRVGLSCCSFMSARLSLPHLPASALPCLLVSLLAFTFPVAGGYTSFELTALTHLSSPLGVKQKCGANPVQLSLSLPSSRKRPPL